MAKKRKSQHHKQVRKLLKPKEGIKIIEKELQDFLMEITQNKQPMAFSKVELKMIYALYIRLSGPFAEPGQHISHKELKTMGRLLQKRLSEPLEKIDGRWYSFRELNLLFCYLQVMDVNIELPERRFTLWKYLGGAANIELSKEDFIDLIFVHLYKTITACSDVRNKVYTLALTSAHIAKKNPIFHFNTRMGVYHAVNKKIKIDGKYRLAYRMIKPRLNGPLFLNYDVGEFKEFHDTDKDKIPVYIQAHALKRMKERLDLLDDEALNYNLFENLVHFKHFYDVRSYILIPYHLYDVKVGYFFCQIFDNCFVIRTFLFITHFSTPEGSELKDICGLGKNDVPYWKIDRLSTFMNVDAEQYPKLSAMFEEAGCGDLFKLHNEEFSVEAMQTANLDGLREYVLKGRMEVEEPVEEFEY